MALDKTQKANRVGVGEPTKMLVVVLYMACTRQSAMDLSTLFSEGIEQSQDDNMNLI